VPQRASAAALDRASSHYMAFRLHPSGSPAAAASRDCSVEDEVTGRVGTAPGGGSRWGSGRRRRRRRIASARVHSDRQRCIGAASRLRSRATGTIGVGVRPHTRPPRGPLARDLPETALCAASRRPTTRSSAAPLTCVVVWGREALCGVVNPWRIDGKDGVAGSIPAGGSTPRLTSGNAGQFRVWRPVEWAMLVVLAFGVALGGRMPDREHFPG
jgi:hypothetical protein